MPDREFDAALRDAHPRPPCSDAERRLALAAAAAVRTRGRRADLTTYWVRGGDAPVAAAHAALGVAASLLAISHPVAGTALAAVVLLSLLLDAGAWVRPLRLLVPARATQALVSPAPSAPGAGATDLFLTVRTDVPRRGLIDRGPLARLAPERILAVALALTAIIGAARIAGADDLAVNVVQMLVTVALLVVGAGLLDRALSRPGAAAGRRGDAALRSALAVLDRLDADPPSRMAVTLVLCGAGSGTMRPVLRGLRRGGVEQTDLAVLELTGTTGETPVWWRSEGRVLPLRFHPALLRAAHATAAAEPHLGAREVRGSDDPPARAARGMRVGAIAIGVPADGEDGAALALGVARRLDDELADTR